MTDIASPPPSSVSGKWKYSMERANTSYLFLMLLLMLLLLELHYILRQPGLLMPHHEESKLLLKPPLLV